MNGDATGPVAKNVRRIAHMDIPGGGQIVAAGGYAYIGHMAPPHGTSILDVSDPQHPRVIASIALADDRSHSHKVRVTGDLMITNSERWHRSGAGRATAIPDATALLETRLGRAPDDRELAREIGVEVGDVPALRDYLERGGYRDGGFRIYDISDRTNPKELAFRKTFGKGVHRFDCDEKYAYISTEMEGYIGNILVIYDITRPERPEEVSRWWIEGQNKGAGEAPDWEGTHIRLHHALRWGDTMWAGCWGGGVAAIDVSDIANPRTVGAYDYHPAFAAVSHTFMKVPFPIDGRDIALAIDEEGRRHVKGRFHAFLWVFDVTEPSDMRPLSTYHVSEADSPWAASSIAAGERFGAHQFREKMDDTFVYATWFAGGLRIVDIADPLHPREAGYFIPEPGPGETRVAGGSAVQSNDVDVDERGLIYLIDRLNGLDILEFTP